MSETPSHYPRLIFARKSGMFRTRVLCAFSALDGSISLSEPVLVTVILKPVPGNFGPEPMAQAFAMLKDWAATQDVAVQPPVNTDAETLRFAVLLARDTDEADRLIAALQDKAFVDTSYRKPPDALP